jgi:hypothetical protein
MKKIFWPFLLALLFCSTAFAGVTDFPSIEYRIGLYKDLVMDTSKTTHIIVVGSAQKEDSDQFFQSGLSRAQRYKDNNPDSQIVIISSPDVYNATNDEIFTRFEVTQVKRVLERFTPKNMLKEMLMFDRIASWDYFGHASAWSMKIGDVGLSFSPYDHLAALKQLREKFLPNAFVTLNACNTGFTIAPDLSEILRIPVAGALTSSVFERIESDGKWYKESDSIEKNLTDLNKISFKETVLCKAGLCNRLKPSRSEYNSTWGHFKEGGLSFNKFFCKFTNTDKKCERGMANALLAFPSVKPISAGSSMDDFKSVAYDWLCSTNKDRNHLSACAQGIEDAIARYDLVYQEMPGNEFMCDFKSCHATVVCDMDETNSPKLGTCHVKTPVNPEPTNLAREMISLVKGYELLKKNLGK